MEQGRGRRRCRAALQPFRASVSLLLSRNGVSPLGDQGGVRSLSPPRLGGKGDAQRDPVPFAGEQPGAGRAAARGSLQVRGRLQGHLQGLGTSQVVAPSSAYNSQN